MSPEHSITPESKELLKTNKQPTLMENIKGAWKTTERPPSGQSRNNWSKQNKVALDYSPKDKISVHESIVI